MRPGGVGALIDSQARLVRDSAATCIVTHYAVSCQWSCVVVNAVIAMLLRGVEPDLRSLMTAAAADGAPDMLATALDDGIPAGVLSAIERWGTGSVRLLLASRAADADRSHAAGCCNVDCGLRSRRWTSRLR